MIYHCITELNCSEDLFLISGVFAFLGYAAAKNLKRRRYEAPYPVLPHYPHHRDYQEPQHYPGELSSPRAAPTVSEERQTKEFLIHKGEKEVGRGWFYSSRENRK